MLLGQFGPCIRAMDAEIISGQDGCNVCVMWAPANNGAA